MSDTEFIASEASPGECDSCDKYGPRTKILSPTQGHGAELCAECLSISLCSTVTRGNKNAGLTVYPIREYHGSNNTQD